MGLALSQDAQKNSAIRNFDDSTYSVTDADAARSADAPPVIDAGDDAVLARLGGPNMPDDVRQMIYGPDSNGIPKTAYAMHTWQLDAWERQSHPEFYRFTVRHGSFGDFDGYVLPEGDGYEGVAASAYVHGWLAGRRSVQDERGSSDRTARPPEPMVE